MNLHATIHEINWSISMDFIEAHDPRNYCQPAFCFFCREFSRSSFNIYFPKHVPRGTWKSAITSAKKEASSGTRENSEQMAERATLTHNELMLRAWDEGKRALHCVFWLALFASEHAREAFNLHPHAVSSNKTTLMWCEGGEGHTKKQIKIFLPTPPFSNNIKNGTPSCLNWELLQHNLKVRD